MYNPFELNILNITSGDEIFLKHKRINKTIPVRLYFEYCGETGITYHAKENKDTGDESTTTLFGAWDELCYIGKIPFEQYKKDIKTPCILMGIDQWIFLNDDDFIISEAIAETKEIIWGSAKEYETAKRLRKVKLNKPDYFLATPNMSEKQIHAYLTSNPTEKAYETFTPLKITAWLERYMQEKKVIFLPKVLPGESEHLSRVFDGTPVIGNSLFNVTPEKQVIFFAIGNTPRLHFKFSNSIPYDGTTGTDGNFGAFETTGTVGVAFHKSVNAEQLRDEIAKYYSLEPNDQDKITGLDLIAFEVACITAEKSKKGKYDYHMINRLFSDGDKITINGIGFDIKDIKPDYLHTDKFKIPYRAIDNIVEYDGRFAIVNQALEHLRSSGWKPLSSAHWSRLKELSLPVLAGYHGSPTLAGYRYSCGRIVTKKLYADEYTGVELDDECWGFLTKNTNSFLIARDQLSKSITNDRIDFVYYYLPSGETEPVFLNEPDDSKSTPENPKDAGTKDEQSAQAPESSDTNESANGSNSMDNEESISPGQQDDNTAPPSSTGTSGGSHSQALEISRNWYDSDVPPRISSDARPPAAINNDIQVVRRFADQGKKLPTNSDQLSAQYDSTFKPDIDKLTSPKTPKDTWASRFFAEILSISTFINTHAEQWGSIEQRMWELNDEVNSFTVSMSIFLHKTQERLEDSPTLGDFDIPLLSIGHEDNQSSKTVAEMLGRLQVLFVAFHRSCQIMAHDIEAFAIPITQTVEPWLGDAICMSNPDRWEWILYRHNKELLAFDSKANDSSAQNTSVLPMIFLGPMGMVIQALDTKQKDLKSAAGRKNALKAIRDHKQLQELMAGLYNQSGSMFDISVAAAGALRMLNSHWEGLADLMASCARLCAEQRDAQMTGIHLRRFQRMTWLVAVLGENTQDVAATLRA
ncbi:hypothetical protein [Pseudomonas sp. UFMG81]|uniref:hypothetical protein n=1 Tax=Pseudomonas sp. UFMG81 TaxID=2745936 RepID=UPI0018900D10|nr:hypothetical protein [Pseudomonas sp. UFMG81]